MRSDPSALKSGASAKSAASTPWRSQVEMLALSSLCLAMGASIGGGLYEGWILTPLWSQNLPQNLWMIQPESGTSQSGVGLEIFWMPVHGVITLSVLLAMVLCFKQRKTRALLFWGFASYLVMRTWSFAYFIPEMIAFQKIDVSAALDPSWVERVERWTTLTWWRMPLDLLSAGSFIAALRAAIVSHGQLGEGAPGSKDGFTAR